jgi:DNA invertase Pin-like site-specific DNA recombinase
VSLDPTLDPSLRVVTYRRISKDDEGDELGIQRQQRALAEYASARGWAIARDFSDNDQSASKGKTRKGYEALLGAIRACEVDVVLCTEVDRLTRHPSELEELVKVVETTSVRIVAMRAGELDLTTSGGRMVARMLGAAAMREVEAMSERLKSKIAQNATKGLAHGGGKTPGYGYRRVKTGELEIVPEQAEVIQRTAARLLAGASLWSLVRDLNEQGIPTSTGGKWRAKTLRQVLMSPRVAGRRPIGTRDADDREVIPSSVEAQWAPILDEVTWRAVVATLTTLRKGPRPRSFLLSGFIYCARCGNRLHSQTSGDRRRYRCDPDAFPSACGTVGVEAGPLEALVVEDVLAQARGANLTAVRAARSSSERARLTQEIADDEQALDDFGKQVARRQLSAREWAGMRPIYWDRLTANRQALAALGAPDPIPMGADVVTDEMWNDLTFEGKRALLRLFVDQVRVEKAPKRANRLDPDRIRLVWRQW